MERSCYSLIDYAFFEYLFLFMFNPNTLDDSELSCPHSLFHSPPQPTKYFFNQMYFKGTIKLNTEVWN